MAKWTDKFKGVLGTVAPLVAAGFGGPLAGTATTILMGKLGITDETQLEQIVTTADAATIEKIKEAEFAFEKLCQDNGIKLESLSNEDRANARDREIKIRDWTPTLLAWTIVAGFFAMFGYVVRFGIPTASEATVGILIGFAGAGFGAVSNYYFGSSAGSRNKQVTIDAAMAKK